MGPAEVAAGAAVAARGIGVLLFGPAGEIGTVPDGVEVVDAPVSIAKATDPAYAVRSTPEASIVQAAKAVADGRAQALVSGGSTGSALAAGLFNLRRDRGSTGRRWRCRFRSGGGTGSAARRGRQRSCRPEHLVQFAHMGAAFAEAVLGITRRAWRCSPTARSRARAPRSSSASTSSWPARRAGLQLRRQRRGHAGDRGPRPTSS